MELHQMTMKNKTLSILLIVLMTMTMASALIITPEKSNINVDYGTPSDSPLSTTDYTTTIFSPHNEENSFQLIINTSKTI